LTEESDISSPEPEAASATPRPAAYDPDSTVGTGSFFAIGCTLLVLIILLVGVGLFIFRQAT
jgi:hypothetical protein